MPKQDPKIHHYIPQFILRFFVNDGGRLLFCDNLKQKYYYQPKKNIFKKDCLYKDDTFLEDPFEVEKSLSKFESDLQPLFFKICKETTIKVSRIEMERLRIFMSLLSFRSLLRNHQYSQEEFSKETKITIDKVSKDLDYVSFWKKEISVLSKCRSYEDIYNCVDVDEAIKKEFLSDIESFYMTIVEARGSEFVLPDVCPALEQYYCEGEIYVLHQIFPISPKRAILLNSVAFRNDNKKFLDSKIKSMLNKSRIKDNAIVAPKNKYKYSMQYHNNQDIFTYRVLLLYKATVNYINYLLLNESITGFVTTDRKILKNIIESYQAEELPKKNDYSLVYADIIKNVLY